MRAQVSNGRTVTLPIGNRMLAFTGRVRPFRSTSDPGWAGTTAADEHTHYLSAD